MRTDIKLAQKVRCEITGFVGIVDHLVYNLHNAMKVGVQALVTDDGKMGECYVLDAHAIKILEEEPVVKAIVSKPKYDLSAKAKCTITGFAGTIISYGLYLNGCVFYKLQPEIPKGKKAEDFASQWIPEGAIKILSKSKKKVKPKKTGGPKEKAAKGMY